MGKNLPQVYEVVTFDEEQAVINMKQLAYSSRSLPGFKQSDLDPNEEREVHFQAVQREEAGAVDYSARLMRPRETRQFLRKLRREEIKDEVIASTARLTGLDRMIELLPVMAEMHQTNTGDAHFARS